MNIYDVEDEEEHVETIVIPIVDEEEGEVEDVLDNLDDRSLSSSPPPSPYNSDQVYALQSVGVFGQFYMSYVWTILNMLRPDSRLNQIIRRSIRSSKRILYPVLYESGCRRNIVHYLMYDRMQHAASTNHYSNCVHPSVLFKCVCIRVSEYQTRVRNHVVGCENCRTVYCPSRLRTRCINSFNYLRARLSLSDYNVCNVHCVRVSLGSNTERLFGTETSCRKIYDNQCYHVWTEMLLTTADFDNYENSEIHHSLANYIYYSENRSLASARHVISVDLNAGTIGVSHGYPD